MDAFPVIFVIAIVGFVVAMIVWGLRHQKQVRENWMKFAQKYGLKMQGGTSFASRPTIQGWFDGVHIQLNTVVRGSGKNRSTYTQHHATVNAPMPNGLVLTKEGLFSKVGKMFGGQDVQIGDRVIDDAFIIKAKDLMGAHDLLSNSHVKKALLYCITRHPGMKVEHRHIVIETNGMTGKLEKLESVFQDMSYLVKTFDAAYQDIAAARGIEAPQTVATPQQTRREAAQAGRDADHARRDADQAEILDMSYRSDREPEVREVSAEDAGAKQAAMAEMAAAVNAFGNKLASEDITDAEKAGEDSTIGASEALSEYDPKKSLAGDTERTSWMGELSGKESDAFKDPEMGDAFDDPHLLDENDFSQSATEHEKEAEHGLKDYDPTAALADAPASADGVDVKNMAFESDAANKAFENPEPYKEETAPEKAESESKDAAEPAREAAGSFEGLIGQLADTSLMSSDREKLIEANAGRSWEIEFTVDRVDSSFGFDLPDRLRDGKTVEGHLEDGSKVAIRFPKEKNDEIKDARRGSNMKAWGKITKYDDLFKKTTLDAE